VIALLIFVFSNDELREETRAFERRGSASLREYFSAACPSCSANRGLILLSTSSAFRSMTQRAAHFPARLSRVRNGIRPSGWRVHVRAADRGIAAAPVAGPPVGPDGPQERDDDQHGDDRRGARPLWRSPVNRWRSYSSSPSRLSSTRSARCCRRAPRTSGPRNMAEPTASGVLFGAQALARRWGAPRGAGRRRLRPERRSPFSGDDRRANLFILSCQDRAGDGVSAPARCARWSPALEPHLRSLADRASLHEAALQQACAYSTLRAALARVGYLQYRPHRQLPLARRWRRPGSRSTAAPGDGRTVSLLPQPMYLGHLISSRDRFRARLVARRGGVRVPRRVVRPARARRRSAPHCSFRGSLPRVSRACETLDPGPSLRFFTETIPRPGEKRIGPEHGVETEQRTEAAEHQRNRDLGDLVHRQPHSQRFARAPRRSVVVGQHDGEGLRRARPRPSRNAVSTSIGAPERNGKRAYVAVAIKSDPVSTPASVKRRARSCIARRTRNAAAA